MVVQSTLAKFLCASVLSVLICGSAMADGQELNEMEYVGGDPDKGTRFPIEIFEMAKQLKTEKKYSQAEGLLLSNLEQARKAARGTDMLGKYLVRLNNIFFDQGNDTEAVKYGEVASKILTKNYYRSRDSIGWLVNVESYLAMSYSRLGKFDKAVKKYTEAITLSEKAPKGKVSDSWIETLKAQRKKILQGTAKATH